MENPNLEFRKIPSLQFLYEVNSNGTVIRNVKSKRHLKCFKKKHNSDTEYWCTQVNIKKHIRKVFLHRVVAECWIGPRPEGMQCDHIDRNSLNNDYRNLRYVTKSGQMLNRDYDKFMESLLNNLAGKNGGVVRPIELTGPDGEKHAFPTSRKAAKWLVERYPEKCEKHFNDKFHMRRHKIFDYDVKYLNAETVRSSSNEQETVQN